MKTVCTEALYRSQTTRPPRIVRKSFELACLLRAQASAVTHHFWSSRSNSRQKLILGRVGSFATARPLGLHALPRARRPGAQD